MGVAVWAVGHAELIAVLAWSSHGASCPLPPGVVFSVVSCTLSSSETRKKRRVYFSVMTFVICPICELWHHLPSPAAVL